MKLKLSNCLICFFASAFQAFGIYHIHSLSAITEGGVFGATLLLDHWFGISPAISGFLLTAACYLLGWRTLGRSFIVYSLIASLVSCACRLSIDVVYCEEVTVFDGVLLIQCHVAVIELHEDETEHHQDRE